MSDKRQGIHFLLVSVMNKLTQSEPDDLATGEGRVHLGSKEHPYLLLQKLSGQQEIMEWLLMPRPNGWQKRHTVVFGPKGVKRDDRQPPQDALNMINNAHRWMYDNFFDKQEPSKHALDKHALVLYTALHDAIEDFKAAWVKDKGTMDKREEEKLDFYHTDVLRAAHLAMRKCQFLKSLNPEYVQKNPEEFVRTSPNAYEFYMALHWWRRQLHVHLAFYRWVKRTGFKNIVAN